MHPEGSETLSVLYGKVSEETRLNWSIYGKYEKHRKVEPLEVDPPWAWGRMGATPGRPYPRGWSPTQRLPQGGLVRGEEGIPT
jgi:hypothetical protein